MFKDGCLSAGLAFYNVRSEDVRRTGQCVMHLIDENKIAVAAENCGTMNR
jgi:hypothetical protein